MWSVSQTQCATSKNLIGSGQVDWSRLFLHSRPLLTSKPAGHTLLDHVSKMYLIRHPDKENTRRDNTLELSLVLDNELMNCLPLKTFTEL